MDTLNDLGRDMVVLSLGVLRSIQTHGPYNDAVSAALGRLETLINGRLELGGGTLQLQRVDSAWLLNGVRLRAPAGQAEHFTAFTHIMSARGIGGFGVTGPVSLEVLRYWFAHLAQRADDEVAQAALRQQLEQVRPHGLVTLAPRTVVRIQAEHPLRIATLPFARESVARAVVSFEEFVLAMSEAKSPYQGRLNLVRGVQDLVESLSARPKLLLEVVKESHQQRAVLGHAYPALHAANTCIYALSLGLALGFDRTTLLDLGTAALLVEAGTALVLGDREEQNTVLSDAEKARRHQLMTRAVQVMLGEEGIDESVLIRVVAAYEHHLPVANASQSLPGEPHLLSRLIAVAGAFDALTSARPWRPALSAPEALSVLRREAATKFDPDVVALLETVITAQ